jgi:diguanylate cyclase (GGDEF)-like protein
MQMAALSIGTVMFVLALMNGAGAVLVLAYLPVSGEKSLLTVFAANKLVHAASWFFRFLDAISSQPGFRLLADFLFVAGCATDAAVYRGFVRPWKIPWLVVYSAIGTGVALAVSQSWTVAPALHYWLLGGSMVGYLGLAAVFLLRPPRRAFRVFMATAYFLLPPLLCLALTQASQEMQFMFMIPDFWGISLFSLAFLLQMLLVFGFFLLSKEMNEERMRQLAETDSLTGAANRRAFFMRVEAFIKEHAGKPTPVSVILMDLDHFKLINDKFGHDTGDRVLKHFCAVVTASIREKDFFARFGGEEFVVFLPDTERPEAETVGRRIHERLRNSHQRLGEEMPNYTVSMGICTGRLNGPPDLARIISLSDQALYHSKSHGRDCSSWTGDEAREIVAL